MTLGERLDKMALQSRSPERGDPIAEAIEKGKSLTLGEVKQSVKVAIYSSPYALLTFLII